MSAFIKAISYHLPEATLDNAAIAKEFPEWSEKKIAAKLGINTRHIVAENECASDLAVAAAERLFDEHGIDRRKIDCLLFCTQSPDYVLPAPSALIHKQLRLSDTCAATDFNLGCSGYVYGLAIAKGLIEAAIATNVLLLTGETYTRHIHPRDRGNRSIFGDAASATLVSTEGFAEIGAFSFGTDGRGADNLIVRTGGSRHPAPANDLTFDENGVPHSSDYLYMDGPEIFNFTIERIPALIDETLNANNLKRSDIDLFVFHQANRYMLSYLRDFLEIDDDRFCFCMEDVGNTVSSTIPIALVHAQREGRLKGNLLLAGFGVGYSWGGCTLHII